jgi:hypothetical protein
MLDGRLRDAETLRNRWHAALLGKRDDDAV